MPSCRGIRESSRCALLALAAAGILAACGSSHPSSTATGPTFPSIPAGVQARWLLQAIDHQPISDAEVRAHFGQAILAHFTPADVNARFVGYGRLHLVSVTSSQPKALVFVLSVRGGQRFRIEVKVDARGLIADLSAQEIPPNASPASVIPALAPGWVAQPITFQASGVTIYGTYTHPRTAALTLPAAVLLGGAGTTSDRNGNRPEQPHRNTLEAVANWLSTDGVASLRYDKLGSGQTGWGRYAAHPDRVGIKPYEQEALAALNFLARQPQVNRARLALFGHSQGGVYALLVATGLAGKAPPVHAIGLLEPLTDRMLNFFTPVPGTPPKLRQALAGAVASLRRTGALPSGVPAAVANSFNPSNWGTHLEVSQFDRYDPAAIAAKLTPRTPVLLTCSNADDKFTCAQEDRIAAGLTEAQAELDYVHLDGVDHFLKEDVTRGEAAYNQALPFSTQLQSALRTFAADNL